MEGTKNELTPYGNPMLIDLLRKVRPAPLQAAILRVTRLSRRRPIIYGEYIFYCDPTSTLGYALLNGTYEPEMVDVLRKYLRTGAIFLDLGTNEGFFSVVASRIVGPTGHVISVEPQTRLIAALQKNLSLNLCYNCRLAQCVLSDENGCATIYLSATTNTGSTSLFRTKRYPVPTETVRSWRIEDLLERCGIETVDLAKVDIEGAEYKVFMSASENFLRSGKLRNIAIEYHNKVLEAQGFSPDRINQRLLSCGYRLNDSFGPRVYEFAGSCPAYS
jgi:FkbM family methyltransferase